MSTGKTTYLGLHRWEPDDDFLRTEFNENSDKLDEELETLQKEIAGEVAAVRGELNSEISAVETALGGKAAASHTHDYAAVSHNHAAGNITSGTLPVARGGTGNTSVDTTPTSGSTKMVTSGGVYTALAGKAASSHTHTPASIGAASSSHNHAAGDITSGTLPVARGGTGVTGLADLVSALKNAGAVSWEVVSYVGTGTYGASNPTSLTFSFAPRFVLYFGKGGTTTPTGIGLGNTTNAYLNAYLPDWPTSYTQYFGIALGGRTDTTYGKKSADGKSISWYNTQQYAQYNDSGSKYYFVAFA